jgi:ankyrin repeat protein
LLSKGAKADLQDRRSGNTALHLAAVNGYLENVRVLLEADTQRTLVNSKGQTALAMAIDQRRNDVAALLQKVE